MPANDAAIEQQVQHALRDDAIVPPLVDLTGRGPDELRAMLASERGSPGSTVLAEMRRRGVGPHVFSEAIEHFYSDSDAFLFELAVWNRTRLKRSMRRWTIRKLADEAARIGRPLRVLCFGDGIGTESLAVALAGQTVTYFELPGLSEKLARRLCDATSARVEFVTDLSSLETRDFDAIVCFDVLEHVPEPRKLLSLLVGKLTSDGLLFLHAPFYLVLSAYATHLRSNRRYAGRLHWFEREGLRLLDGGWSWSPLLLRRGSSLSRAGMLKRGWLRFIGLLLQSGRYTSFQFLPFHWLLRRG